MSGSFGKKIVLSVLALLGAALVFMTCYRLHYSMDVARAFEVVGSLARTSDSSADVI